MYVPLNLATSIFGMNIEQLNKSGQNLSVFIITAVLTLVVTGGSWFLIEQTNSYRKWRRRSPKQQYDGKTQFSLAVRLALIAWLVSNGHTHWMFKSGAWWRIAIDRKSRIEGLSVLEEDDGRLTASEYVSKYNKASFNSVVDDYFQLNYIRWTSPREEDD